ncbi:MAG: tetratricopeptide repeat protein [Cyclobacteriaceae bacterium]|nr:tetratricopeptide repeat protein [Cyclobacteriaceae bacterium]
MKGVVLAMIWCLLIQVPTQAQDSQRIGLANEYFAKGDLEKAKVLYEELSRKNRNIPQIHNRYLTVLAQLGDYDQGVSYLQKLIHQFPAVVQYPLDLGIFYRKAGKPDQADQQIIRTLQSIKNQKYQIISAAQYLFNKQETPFALKAYQLGREAEKDPHLYALEMAEIHRRMSQKTEMVNEYLNFANSNPNNINYVKNILQNLLTDEEDLIQLEKLLYEKIQKNPNESLYASLLIWVNLQQQNFYGAFVQARALDKREKGGGTRVLEIGKIALDNNDYKNAIKVFTHVAKNTKTGVNYELAKRFLVKSREELVKNTFPVDLEEIRHLIKDYDEIIVEIGKNERTLEAMRSQALLYAFYLDRRDSAISILQNIVSTPGIKSSLQNQAKLDLGDIYLLNQEHWESTLLYSQVEKAQKDQPLGYEAKLRNAKLSYFKGDFELAQGHLDILKLATSREISNNAMALSLLIQDNTVFDTTDLAMQAYADVELTLFQNRRQEALLKLNHLLESYPGHSLTDEILWLQSNIYLELGNFDKALELLNDVVTGYQYDILSDDAYFLMGTIYEDQLQNAQKAMEIYQDFLTKFPGSIYSAEARKRFRSLRGDFDEGPPNLQENFN